MVGERNHSPYLGTSKVATNGTIGGSLVEVPALSAEYYAYPALLPGAGRVVVDVIELAAPEVLASVDRLELEVDDQGRAEYERALTIVRSPTGVELEAWCYHYRWSVSASWRPIPGGDWRLRHR